MNEKAIENLKIRLSSPRLRAPTTLIGYLNTAERFLKWLKKPKPTENDIRLYFINRRKQDTSESTMRKEFFQIKKLCQANDWVFPFAKEDTPVSEEEPYAPAFSVEEIEKFIMAQKLYTPAERFYLCISTIYGARREELARIKKRDYDDQTILIRVAKHGRKVRHLIPDVLKVVFEDYHAKEHATASLSKMFHRICRKASVQVGKGYGFHSIRRSVTSMLIAACGANRYDPMMVADFQGWSKKSMGAAFTGAAMVGIYRHPEVTEHDEYFDDRALYKAHRYLKMWEKALRQRNAARSRKSE